MRLSIRALGLLPILGAALLVAGASLAKAEDAPAAFSDPTRIAAIGGSITEIVFALGEGDRLVARDSTGLYPPEALALPDVGYMRALSPEGVLSVNPSGILALAGSGPVSAIDVLKKTGVEYIEVPERFDEAGIIDKIDVVGRAIGAEAKASALAATVKADLDAAREKAAAHTERKRVLFVLSYQGGRFLAAGRKTAAEGIIRMAGADNAVTGFEGYKLLSDETITEAKPDVVLMMDHAGPEGASAEEMFANPALATTPAGVSRSLVKMDGGYLLGFGPRTANAIRDLSTALYGN